MRFWLSQNRNPETSFMRTSVAFEHQKFGRDVEAQFGGGDSRAVRTTCGGSHRITETLESDEQRISSALQIHGVLM